MAQDGKAFGDFMRLREAVSTDYINGRADGLLGLSTTNDPATFFPPSGDRIHGAGQVNAANKKGAQAFREGSTGHFEILHSASSGDPGFGLVFNTPRS